MVVIIEAGLFQLLGLAFLQHAQCRTGLQTHGLDLLHHLQHRFQVALLGAAPGSAHAETAGSAFLGRPGRCQHFIQLQQVLVLDIGVIARRLRAVAAILGAAAGLDREQRADLHRIGVEIFTMHGLRAVDQITERQFEQIHNLRHSPTLRCLRSRGVLLDGTGIYDGFNHAHCGSLMFV